MAEHGQELCQDQGLPKSTKPSGCERHLEWRGARTGWRRICVLYSSRFQKASRSRVRVWTFRKPKPNSHHCLYPKRSNRGIGSINCQYCLAFERERGILGIHCQSCLDIECERGLFRVPSQCSFCYFNSTLDFSTNFVYTFDYCCHFISPSTTAAPPPPPPPSSIAEAPQTTSTAVAKLNSVDVAIWTNYITDNGAALEAAEKDTCAFVVTN